MRTSTTALTYISGEFVGDPAGSFDVENKESPKKEQTKLPRKSPATKSDESSIQMIKQTNTAVPKMLQTPKFLQLSVTNAKPKPASKISEILRLHLTGRVSDGPANEGDDDPFDFPSQTHTVDVCTKYSTRKDRTEDARRTETQRKMILLEDASDDYDTLTTHTTLNTNTNTNTNSKTNQNDDETCMVLEDKEFYDKSYFCDIELAETRYEREEKEVLSEENEMEIEDFVGDVGVVSFENYFDDFYKPVALATAPVSKPSTLKLSSNKDGKEPLLKTNVFQSTKRSITNTNAEANTNTISSMFSELNQNLARSEKGSIPEHTNSTKKMLANTPMGKPPTLPQPVLKYLSSIPRTNTPGHRRWLLRLFHSWTRGSSTSAIYLLRMTAMIRTNKLPRFMTAQRKTQR